MQNRQAVIILSAQDLLSKPTSANHNLKFFPVIQCARPQLHKIEKTHYKWPEPLENCGNVASGCKALSCGKKILQLSINTVSLLRKSAHTLSFIKKGFSYGLFKTLNENGTSFLPHYSDLFISPPPFLPHASAIEENENPEHRNKCTGTSSHMAWRHHHWILQVVTDFWTTRRKEMLKECLKNESLSLFHQ